ncbi:hypothetical protein BG004_004070 [Podila humilis]|nr:hypothetical protein BG004_004070 [Podila humilis]
MSTHHQQPTFVDANVVEELVKDKTKIPRKDYLIIDVRDADYIGGHIPGCLNIPSSELPEQLPRLLEEHKAVPQLFFHCALSQVRGPKAANRWSEALAVSAESTGVHSTQKVNILRGGFGEWQQKHKDNKELVEEYDAQYWTEEFH